MLNDAQVLAALSEWLSPGEIAQVLKRILRVPEAWQHLHDATFLSRVREAQLPSPFLPAQLGLLSLGMPADREALLDSLPDGLAAQQEQVWHRALHAVPPDPDLEGVQLLALALNKKAEEPQGPERLASFVLSAPRTWRSPLACAWMHLPASTTTLSGLLSTELPQGIMLAANSLLANLGPEEAARIWLSAQPQPPAEVLLKLCNLGEPALSAALASQRGKGKNAETEGAQPDSVQDLLALAARKQIAQELQPAHDALDRAWSTVVRSTSIVAEQLAELARAEGDYVLAAEARKQALSAEATPQRRAWLAIALHELGRSDEALSALPKKMQSPEEQIAGALIHLKLGQKHQAADCLRAAVQATGKMEQMDGRWLDWLSQALKQSGEIGQALDIARLRLSEAPCDLEARIAISKLLAEAGDHASAAQEAHLTLALAPESLSARRALAQQLQAADQAQAALAHWQALVEDDPSNAADLIACALAAGEVELARESAQAALRKSPENAGMQVLFAKTLIAGADYDGARNRLEQALELDPHIPEAWLALAECFARAGDVGSQGSTLASAVQAAPEQATLHMAYARWLQSSGRLSEAMEAAERAIELSPDQAEWLITNSELLEALGHGDQALDVLHKAHSFQPANWQVRRRLAEVYETRNDPRFAWSFLGHVPDEQDAETHFMTGRIAVQAALQGEPAALESAVIHLRKAKADGYVEPALPFWLGTARMLAKKIPDAIESLRECLSLATPGSELHRQAAKKLAECLASQGQAEQAVALLESTLPHFPAEVDMLVSLSHALLATGHADRALTVAQQAVEADSESGQGLLQLALAAEASERMDLALDAAGRRSQLLHRDAGAWLELARLESAAGRTAHARHAIARAAFLGRKDTSVLQRCASVLIKLGSLPSAQRMLQHASTLQPTDASLLRQLADIAQQNRDPMTAQRAWAGIAALQPDSSETQYRAGMSFWEMNHAPEAIEHWQRALELDPMNAAAHSALGRALAARGDHERGMKHFESAMELSPEDAQMAFEAGRIALQSGKAQEAEKLLQRSARLVPENVEFTEALAKCLLDLNRPTEAHEALKRACIQNEAPPSVHALRAVAALHTGDFQGSEQALADAVSATPKSAQDASDFAQAAMRLGRWGEALQVSLRWVEQSEDPFALLAHTRLLLRLTDAHWLYAVQCEAGKHAPNDACLEHASQEHLMEWMERSQAAGAPQTEIEKLMLRISVGDEAASEDAFATLEAQLSLKPDAEAAEGLAIAYLRSARPDEALQVLRAHFPSGNGAGWARILTGIALALTDQHTQAREAFDLAGNDPALRPLSQFLESLSLAARGDINRAAGSLSLASAAWPDEASWHFRLAQLYAQADDLDAAMPHYQQASELNPEMGQYILEFARTLRDLGQSSAAAAAYSKVVKTEPEDSSAWREAGEAALVGRKPKQARDWFERACSISPSDAASLMGSARAYQDMGDLHEAQERAQAALRLAPKDPDVLTGLAEILASRGQLEKAIRTYDQALGIAPDPVAVQLRRGELMIKLGRAAQAVEQLIEIVRHHPDDDRIWGALTDALDEAGDQESAVEAASRAVRLAPRNAAYRLGLGRACRKSGHLDRAIKELTQAQAFAPAESAIAIELGKAYSQRRERTRALEAFQQAISINPDSAPAYFGAAMIYKELKDYQEASDALGKALELDPNDPEAHHQLAAVRALALVHGGILQSVE